MRVAYHRIARCLFDALAVGGGGPDAIGELAAGQYSKHVILVRGVLAAARSAAAQHGHDGRDVRQAGFAREGYELLAAARRRDPAAVAEVIRYPSVGAWALRTIMALRGGPAWPGAEPGGLRAMAAAAAIRARLPAQIEVATSGGMVVLPSLGAALVPDGRGAVVRSTPGGAEVRSADVRVEVPADPDVPAPGWLPLRRLQAGSLRVALDDLDPFRMPALADLPARLGASEARSWEAELRAAWPLLDAPSAAEVSRAVSVIVPRLVRPGDHVSSTSPENFGAIAMAHPPDPLACAATLVHETQHLKLFALLDIVALTLPDDGRRYYAPWREDSRPVGALLQGAYAHLGVGRFWRAQGQETGGDTRLRAYTEFARWRSSVGQVVGTLLSSGRLTPPGVDFVRGMARTLKSWQDEPVPAAARAAADRQAAAHLTRWRLDHG
jgi:HEXXH motif-containing protein